MRYSEDVKESLTQAQKLAKKHNSDHLTDAHLLKGLLLTERKFNRLDALLTELRVPASVLKHDFHLPGATEAEAGQSSPETVLKQAEQCAAGTEPPGSQPVVEVEHLLKALTASQHPVVRQIMAENDITPERIDTAMLRVKSKSTRRTALYVTKELLEIVTFVLVFLILIKSFLGEMRLIPSESMVPGLQVEDRLVIERLTHWVRPYQRGDVLVFYPPSPITELRNDPWSVFLRLTGFSGLIYRKEDRIDVAYIKRVIGLPGDIVDVRPGDGVYINGVRLDEPYISEVANSCTVVMPVQTCEPVRVPEDSYYMMGDNRNRSQDSRYWGFARENRVLGRAVFRIWPPGRIGVVEGAEYPGVPEAE